MTVKGTSGTLSGLEENIPYAITVQAMTEDGRKSAVSSEVSVRTHAAGKSYIYIYYTTVNEILLLYSS